MEQTLVSELFEAYGVLAIIVAMLAWAVKYFKEKADEREKEKDELYKELITVSRETASALETVADIINVLKSK